MFEYLPQELLIEIFLKLPIKSIIQCTSFCFRLILGASFNLLEGQSFLKELGMRGNLLCSWVLKLFD
uniref:Uncharacterized protein LOC104226219 isoform X2 n=1 Tax=Nicotiana sylvestris TaxID=4096 RepID=A0A1U7WGR5_NICSY|nr:PREDICTED: uncharacterized protein LOC104226219 isoform X2 [Nicotiana sylvestris]